jgi:hypothetical protein
MNKQLIKEALELLKEKTAKEAIDKYHAEGASFIPSMERMSEIDNTIKQINQLP